MSLEALEWVRQNAQDIKGSHRLLLLEIADCIRKEEGGWGWSTRQRLLDRANVSRDVYQRAITALREAGLIEVDVHGGGDPDVQQHKQNRPNAYFFLPLLDDARREQLQEVRATNDARREQQRERTPRARPPKRSKTCATTTMPEGVVGAPSEGVVSAPVDRRPG